MSNFRYNPKETWEYNLRRFVRWRTDSVDDAHADVCEFIERYHKRIVEIDDKGKWIDSRISTKVK